MSELKKTLGAGSGTAMMLNVVLGAGLLILPGLAAKIASVASFWAWVAAIGAALPLLWVFAMLSAKFPDAGGIAHLVEQVFGRIGALVASFIFLGAVFLGLPAVALTGDYYYEAVVATLPGAPAWLLDSNSAAMLLLCLSCGLNLCAPDKAKKVGAAAAVLMSVFIVGLIVAAVFSLRTEIPPEVIRTNLSVIFLPANMDWPATSAIFFMVFFAFTGWEVAIGMSGEFKNPSRNIPIAIFTFVCFGGVAEYRLCVGGVGGRAKCLARGGVCVSAAGEIWRIGGVWRGGFDCGEFIRRDLGRVAADFFVGGEAGLAADNCQTFR